MISTYPTSESRITPPSVPAFDYFPDPIKDPRGYIPRMSLLYCQLPAPTPRVRLTELLRPGPRYEIWAGDQDGERVCVKLPAVNRGATSLYSMNHYLSQGSETFSGGNTQPYQPDRELLGDLLEIEAHTIAQVGKAWNHRILGVGRVLRDEGDADPREWSRAFVMPRYDGFTLGSVEVGRRAALFEEILPALWRALSESPHGDLNEANLIVDPVRSRFHLIDPGVRRTAWWATDPSSMGLRDQVWNAAFITTQANYPVLQPIFAADDARRAMTLPDSKDGDLDRFDDDLYLYYDQLTTDNDDLFGMVESHALVSRLGVLGVKARHRETATHPDPPDLLAMGIIYFRALTGDEAFLGPTGLLPAPAWVGPHPRMGTPGQVTRGPIAETYERLAQALPGWIDARVNDFRIPRNKRGLLRGLLTLQVRSTRELHQLLAS